MTEPLTIVIALSALGIGTLAGSALQKAIHAYRDTRATLARLESKIDQLELKGNRRNPYRTNDGLEDAMAIVHDAVWQADATLDYVRARMRQVDKTLQTIRTDPDSYNSEQPNQKRA